MPRAALRAIDRPPASENGRPTNIRAASDFGENGVVKCGEPLLECRFVEPGRSDADASDAHIFQSLDAIKIDATCTYREFDLGRVTAQLVALCAQNLNQMTDLLGIGNGREESVTVACGPFCRDVCMATHDNREMAWTGLGFECIGPQL